MQSYLSFLRGNANWLLAGVLLSFASCFGQTFVLAVVGGDIRAEFGLSDGEWAGVFTVATLACAVVAAWAGALTDHMRVRALGALVLAGLAASCLLMAAAPSVWALVLAVFFLRFFGIRMATHIASVAMTRWFVAQRGRALAISTLGFAIAEGTLPLSIVALKDATSWRWVWVAAAVIILALIPVLILLLKTERTPQSIATETPVFGLGERHWLRREVLGHWLFWACLPALIAPWAAGTSFFFHQVHLAAERGWAHVALVALFPIYTVSWITATMVSGWLVDRFGAVRLMPWYQTSYIAAFLVMGFTQSLWGAAVGLVFLGIGSGAHAAVPPVFWAEIYGTRHLGAIKAMVSSIMVFGAAMGPGIVGALIDRGVDFGQQMVWFAIWFAASSALVGVALARMRRSPVTAEIDVIRP